MEPAEKVMQYVTRLTEVENKFTAIGHVLNSAEKKHLML